MPACFCDIRLLQAQKKEGGEKSEDHWHVFRYLFFLEVCNEIASASKISLC